MSKGYDYEPISVRNDAINSSIALFILEPSLEERDRMYQRVMEELPVDDFGERGHAVGTSNPSGFSFSDILDAVTRLSDTLIHLGEAEVRFSRFAR